VKERQQRGEIGVEGRRCCASHQKRARSKSKLAHVGNETGGEWLTRATANLPSDLIAITPATQARPGTQHVVTVLE
jgi:hypothetical protein